jgi:hypothetical protein
LEIANSGPDAIPVVMVFENFKGRLGYRVALNVKDPILLKPPDLTANPEQVRRALANHLIAAGLYEKEALAMIETWRDSWFEEGTRVFYLYPRSTVDALLPLRVTPAPSETARVFVGRVELLSIWRRNAITSAIGRGETEPLVRFGRFLDPFIEQIQRRDGTQLFSNPHLLAARREIIEGQNPRGCVD